MVGTEFGKSGNFIFTHRMSGENGSSKKSRKIREVLSSYCNDSDFLYSITHPVECDSCQLYPFLYDSLLYNHYEAQVPFCYENKNLVAKNRLKYQGKSGENEQHFTENLQENQ